MFGGLKKKSGGLKKNVRWAEKNVRCAGKNVWWAEKNVWCAEKKIGGLKVRGVYCMSQCKRSCVVSFTAPDRFTYTFGDLDPKTLEI